MRKPSINLTHVLKTKRSYVHFIISNIFSLSISLCVKKGGKKICVWNFFIYVFILNMSEESIS